MAVNETESPAEGGLQYDPDRLMYWLGELQSGSSHVQTFPFAVKDGKALKGRGGLLAGHLTMNAEASV